jgi:hypothetical protein
MPAQMEPEGEYDNKINETSSYGRFFVGKMKFCIFNKSKNA